MFAVWFRLASDSGPAGSNYFILLILTDGIITDMPQTCEAIVNVRISCCSVEALCIQVVLSVCDTDRGHYDRDASDW